LQRERRLRLWVLAGFLTALLVALAFPAYGYYTQVLHPNDQPVLTVDGQVTSLEQYARYVGTRQQILTKQLALIQPLAQPPGATPTAQPSAAQSGAQSTMQVLQSEQAGLPQSGLSELAEAKLVLVEAQTRGLSANQQELDDALRWFASTPGLNLQPQSSLPAVPSTLPVTGTVTLAEAKLTLPALEGNGKYLTEAQITDLILKPAVLKEKLVLALAPNVPTTENAIHARHILVATQQEATDIKAQLVAGADFAQLAAKLSTDTGSKTSGGDLGWFGKGVMVPEFETAAFALNPGQISDPVKSSFGYHIIQVLEKDPNHPIDPTRTEQLRLQPYQQWLSTAQSDPTRVTFSSSSPKLAWLQSYLGPGS
jgi:PPIC-type PPIASE domain